MQLISYTINHFNNTLNIYSSNEKLYTSAWFMEFGKTVSEIYNKDEK